MKDPKIKETVAPGYFAATVWSPVLKAKGSDEEIQLAAPGRLIECNHGPIAREIQSRQRCDPDRAKDLCQESRNFLDLLRK